MEDDFKNAKWMMTILMVRFPGLPGSMDLRSNLELNQSERPCTRELVQVCLAVGSNWDMMGTPSGEEVLAGGGHHISGGCGSAASEITDGMVSRNFTGT